MSKGLGVSGKTEEALNRAGASPALFMLRSLDMYLEFISIKAIFSSTMETFQFCI